MGSHSVVVYIICFRNDYTNLRIPSIGFRLVGSPSLISNADEMLVLA